MLCVLLAINAIVVIFNSVLQGLMLLKKGRVNAMRVLKDIIVRKEQSYQFPVLKAAITQSHMRPILAVVWSVPRTTTVALQLVFLMHVLIRQYPSKVLRAKTIVFLRYLAS